MSDSSDEGEPFRLRDYEEESDEDSLRPNKRRKTQASSFLRTRGLAFVQKSNQDDDEEKAEAEQRQNGDDDDDDEDFDDERPTMGGMGGMRSGFNIGQFQPAQVEEEPLEMEDASTPEKASGQGPSAFHSGGKVNKNSFAARMMAKMGHVEGQGLGRAGQGIAAPIQAQKMQVGSGLGFGSQPEPQLKPLKKKREALPGTPTSGASTPRLKAPPKKKYEVAAIESRGLHVPDAVKVIIDATGTENKTLTSLSGYSTPLSDAPKPVSEDEKIQARLKRDLKLFADAWDGQVEESDVLEKELARSAQETDHYTEQSQLFNDMMVSFERVAVDDSQQQRPFDQVIQRLQHIQTQYADYIEPLDLSDLAIATLDKPFQTAILNLDDMLAQTGAEIVSQLLTLPSLLQISRASSSRHRRHTTLLESLLLKHLYPRLRDTFRGWSIYDPVPAKNLIETWYPSILPPWMLYKLCQEIILPRLLEGVRRFKPPHKQSSSKKRDKVPNIHEWIFDWWTLFETLDLESFHQLKVEIKNKVRFDPEAWPKWESLLGRREKKPQPETKPTTQAEVVPEVALEEITFKDILEQFCTENDLLLRPTGSADSQGRRLLRLQAAEKGVGGMLVYIQGDLVFEASTEEPWLLDEELVEKVRGRK